MEPSAFSGAQNGQQVEEIITPDSTGNAGANNVGVNSSPPSSANWQQQQQQQQQHYQSNSTNQSGGYQQGSQIDTYALFGIQPAVSTNYDALNGNYYGQGDWAGNVGNGRLNFNAQSFISSQQHPSTQFYHNGQQYSSAFK